MEKFKTHRERCVLPVAVDVFFATRNPQGRRLHSFVEADRGSMKISRFTQKLLAYTAY